MRHVLGRMIQKRERAQCTQTAFDRGQDWFQLDIDSHPCVVIGYLVFAVDGYFRLLFLPLFINPFPFFLF